MPWRFNETTLATFTDTQDPLEFYPDDIGRTTTFEWADSVATEHGKLHIAGSQAAHMLRKEPLNPHGDSIGVLIENKIMHSLPGKEYITIFQIHAAEPHRRHRIVSIPVAAAPYIHSFGITETHAVIVAQPLHFHMLGLMSGKGLLDSMLLSKGENTTMFLVSLKDGTWQEFSTEYFLMGHIVNSFNVMNEDGSVAAITFEISCFTEGYWTTLFDLKTLWNRHARDTFPTGSQIRQYTLRMNGGEVSMREITPMKHNGIIELPRMNTNWFTRKSCFSYMWETHHNSSSFSDHALVKYNSCREQPTLEGVFFKRSHFPGEPYFVARPGSRVEDDGVLITVVFDGSDMAHPRSYLAIICAQKMSLLATAELPFVVPFLVHGMWDPAIN